MTGLTVSKGPVLRGSGRPLELLLEKHGQRCSLCWEIPQGWFQLVDNLFGNLKNMGWEGKIRFIGESFGRLRIDLSDLSTPAQMSLRAQSETDSVDSCLECGSILTSKVARLEWQTGEEGEAAFCSAHLPSRAE